MNLIDELLKAGAKAVLETKTVLPEIAKKRMQVCMGCARFNAEKIKCNACGCYLEVKVECETNYNPKKLRHEVTHCPMGLWDDIAIANQYRTLDGQPLIQ